MRRDSSIVPRRAIFIGVEGSSDRAFVQFLRLCCERQGRRLHLDVKVGQGGDSVAVVEHAACHLSRRSFNKEFSAKLVLLDSDRIERDKEAGRDARAVAKRHGLKIIMQAPNLEGLLVRLHGRHERRQVPANNADAELKKLWPEYEKSVTKEQLARRFDIAAVHRAAMHDRDLRELLTILEITEQHSSCSPT